MWHDLLSITFSRNIVLNFFAEYIFVSEIFVKKYRGHISSRKQGKTKINTFRNIEYIIILVEIWGKIATAIWNCDPRLFYGFESGKYVQIVVIWTNNKQYN